ncbi:MAG TPA: hypothetical protein VFA32_02555 [Dehalococcoidia bacterium]|nr:hypothetical protein [Dehalococcoidia bacterium]
MHGLPQAKVSPKGYKSRVHDEFYFVPNFLVVTIYGLSENLEWEPTYAPRVRANTMTFTQ